MKIKLEGRDFGNTATLKGKTLSDLYKEQKIIGENYVASRKGKIILEDEELDEGDIIELHSVISGG